MLLRDNLAHNARIHPRRTALSSGRIHISYADLQDRIRRYASALAALGVEKGDRVAILSPSTPSYVELLFAVAQIGAVLVPLNQLSVPREHRTILRDASPRVLLFAEGFEDTVAALPPGLPDGLAVLRIDRGVAGYPGLLDAGRGETALPLDRVAVSEEDIALQIYTSGTSGQPRGAMLSHGNLMAASASVALELGLSRNDIFLSCTSLPFMGGIGRLLRFLYVGGRIVIQNDFDPEEVLRAIERSRITHILLTPTMMAQILDLPSGDSFNLATLRKVLYGGPFIPLDLLKRAIRFFGCDMVQSYGQVESGGVLTFLHPEDHSLDESAPYMRRLMSVGKEAIGVEIRLVNEEGSEVPPGQVGEVIARGKNIFAGYSGDPDFSAEVLRNGWLYTGDVGSLDEEGYLYLLDRKRDTLMIGGISVYPREIENILVEHPAVAEAAVVPRPHYVLGEIPVAIVVLKEGRQADPDALLDHCRRNMAPFKVPRAIEFLSSLPRNSAGKVLKVKLKEQIVRGNVTPRTPRP
ncbi:MAG: class I adenylate-forming enzyme family protein [Candidatus Deferrimicrobiaceae bacterium]